MTDEQAVRAAVPEARLTDATDRTGRRFRIVDYRGRAVCGWAGSPDVAWAASAVGLGLRPPGPGEPAGPQDGADRDAVERWAGHAIRLGVTAEPVQDRPDPADVAAVLADAPGAVVEVQSWDDSRARAYRITVPGTGPVLGERTRFPDRATAWAAAALYVRYRRACQTGADACRTVDGPQQRDNIRQIRW